MKQDDEEEESSTDEELTKLQFFLKWESRFIDCNVNYKLEVTFFHIMDHPTNVCWTHLLSKLLMCLKCQLNL